MGKDLLQKSCHLRWLALLALGLASGCGNGTKPSAAVDAGAVRIKPECDADHPCGSGQLCALNHCYPACTDDTDCSTRERCADQGVLAGLCIAVADAGIAADPCDQAVCGGAAPVCHPTSGTCVACTEAEHCAGDRPICDRGRGICVARALPALCQPCNANADCREVDAGVSLACVALDDAFERACLPAHCAQDADCPPGFACSPGLGACVPRNASCTAYAAARAVTACRVDADCSAVGISSTSPLSGACRDQHCVFVCLTSADCPNGLECTGAVCVPLRADAGVPPDASSGV